MSFEVLNQNWSFKFNEQKIRTALIVTPLKKFPTAFGEFCENVLEATGAEVSRHLDYRQVDNR